MFARSIQETKRVTRRVALQEGRKKGIAEGLQKGTAQEKARIASQVKSLGLPPEMLAQVIQAITQTH